MGFPFPRPGRPKVRETARILLADGQDRVLLFRFADDPGDPAGSAWWGTPGGGVERGEPLSRAASRELFEETGLRVAPADLGPVVAWNQGRARFAGRTRWFVNRYYFHRCAEFAFDDAGWQELERSLITGHRWWGVADLAATGERIHPPGLARLLPDLLAGRLPAEPVNVGPERGPVHGILARCRP